MCEKSVLTEMAEKLYAKTYDQCANCGERGIPEYVLVANLGWCAQCVMATRKTRRSHV